MPCLAPRRRLLQPGQAYPVPRESMPPSICMLAARGFAFRNSPATSTLPLPFYAHHGIWGSHVIFSRWPIRNKLQLGLGLLAASVLTLFGSAYYGLYAYRGLVKSLSARSTELPLADQLRECLAEMHEILSQVEDQQRFDEISAGALATSNATDQTVWDADGIFGQKCRSQFDLFCQTLERYRDQLDTNRLHTDPGIGDDTYERDTLAKIDDILAKISKRDS